MPRYFFHLTNDDRSTIDPDGVGLADPEAAAEEASELAKTLLHHSLVDAQDWAGWRVDVYDERHHKILSVAMQGVAEGHPADADGPGQQAGERGRAPRRR